MLWVYLIHDGGYVCEDWGGCYTGGLRFGDFGEQTTDDNVVYSERYSWGSRAP